MSMVESKLKIVVMKVQIMILNKKSKKQSKKKMTRIP